MNYLYKLLDGVEVEWHRLGDEKFIEIANSSRRPIKASERVAGNIPYYGVNKIQDYVDGFTHNGEYILVAEDGRLNLKRYSVQWAEGKFWANNHVNVIRGTNLMNSRFIYYYLQTLNFTPFLYGSERMKLTKGKLGEIPIPIPYPNNPQKSLEIQQRIVNTLDKFSTLIDELTLESLTRKKQYEYYREQLLSFKKVNVKYQHLGGDGGLGKFIRGKRFTRADMGSKGIPCIHYGEMYTHYSIWATVSKSFLKEELVESKKFRVAPKGSVIIVASGETIEDIGLGTAWLGNGGVVFHDSCFSYTSPLNPKYVGYFTRTKQFHNQIKKYISSSKISAITDKGLSNVVIPIPSTEEQERIVNTLDKFEALINSVTEGLPKEIELRKRQLKYYMTSIFGRLTKGSNNN